MPYRMRFSPDCFVVLFSDPRRLGVLFRRGSFQIVFASLHAPHRGTSEHETETILYRAAAGRVLVVGADCNASIGTVETTCVSSCGAEEQDLTGGLLHSCMHKCDLWAPATWADIQEGPGWTFVQRRNGAVARLDFVLLPAAWRQGSIKTWTCPDISAANMVVDHVATVAEVCISTLCRPAGRSEPPCRIDTGALVAPANRARVQAILQEAPQPEWQVSAHSHAAIVTEYLQSSLADAFPSAPRRPVHPHLSEDTWNLQKQVAWLRRKCVSVKDAIRRHTGPFVLCFWVGARVQVCAPRYPEPGFASTSTR